MYTLCYDVSSLEIEYINMHCEGCLTWIIHQIYLNNISIISQYYPKISSELCLILILDLSAIPTWILYAKMKCVESL